MSCAVKPATWLKDAFRFPNGRPTAMTIQCPAHPWAFNTPWGEGDNAFGQPELGLCGLSTLDRVKFSGKGTDTTCCFDQLKTFSSCYQSSYQSEPNCDRYSYYNSKYTQTYKYCQNMASCLDKGRMAWPFWSGARLSTDGEKNVCYEETLPEETLPALSRLPALDIRSIPRMASSPFTGQPYCETSSSGVQVNTWGVPTLCGSDMTRFLSDIVGSSLPDARDNTTWPRFDAVNNTATRAVVSLLDDGDTVTCEPEWVRADATRPTPGTRWVAPSVVSKVISVSAGPVSVADADISYPTVGVDLYFSAGPKSPPQTSVSLTKLLGSFQPALPRTILCAIRGRDLGNNGLPVFAFGTAAVVSANGSSSGRPLLIPEWDFPLATCAGGRLVNNATDKANCGTCGTVCPSDAECVAGMCLCTRIVTTSLSIMTSRAANITARLLGGGGGAAGGVYSATSGAGSGGGGGGGSTAFVVRGVASSPPLVAFGGAGGRPAGWISNATAAWAEAEAQGLPGDVAIGTVTVPAGATLDVIVGGGGGGGGGGGAKLSDGFVFQLGGGGSGGAGFFGGGGGFRGQVNGSRVLRERATGGSGTSGGTGAANGALGAGGDGEGAFLVEGFERQTLPAATGGQPSFGGHGQNGTKLGYTSRNVMVGGVGGGGSYGAGGGAGTSGSTENDIYGLSGGDPGSDGGGGASGASTWASGIRVGAGSGGRISLSSSVSGGGAAGLAILRWPAAAGTCAL